MLILIICHYPPSVARHILTTINQRSTPWNILTDCVLKMRFFFTILNIFPFSFYFTICNVHSFCKLLLLFLYRQVLPLYHVRLTIPALSDHWFIVILRYFNKLIMFNTHYAHVLDLCLASHGENCCNDPKIYHFKLIFWLRKLTLFHHN